MSKQRRKDHEVYLLTLTKGGATKQRFKFKYSGKEMGEVIRVSPHVIVTYAVHGIGGFHDHLVTHAVVKHCFVELKDRVPDLKRLAFHTISEDEAAKSLYFPGNLRSKYPTIALSFLRHLFFPEAE